MPKNPIKKSIFSRIRNNFIAGVVTLIPIGITLYLTLFIIKLSEKAIPREINPNNYLPFDIPGLEILIAIFIARVTYLILAIHITIIIVKRIAIFIAVIIAIHV